MANIAIEVKAGNNPHEWKKGRKWYISDGNENTKISSETIMEIITTGIEKEFASRGMKDFIQMENHESL